MDITTEHRRTAAAFSKAVSADLAAFIASRLKEKGEKPAIVNRIEEMLASDWDAFGCERKNVVSLVSAIIGHEVQDAASIAFENFVRLDDFGWACVVPLSNPNAHNYSLGDTVLVVNGTTMGLRVNGTYGNNLPQSPGSIRAATEEETDAFFENCATNIIERMMSTVEQALKMQRYLTPAG